MRTHAASGRPPWSLAVASGHRSPPTAGTTSRPVGWAPASFPSPCSGRGPGGAGARWDADQGSPCQAARARMHGAC